MAGKRQRLAQRRKARGYTQETLAGALHVDRTTVQRWERGDVDPQPNQRPRIAKLLRVTSEELDELLKTDTHLTVSERLPVLNGERGDGFAHTVREISQRLIVLDN